jgi:hypothetical protein
MQKIVLVLSAFVLLSCSKNNTQNHQTSNNLENIHEFDPSLFDPIFPVSDPVDPVFDHVFKQTHEPSYQLDPYAERIEEDRPFSEALYQLKKVDQDFVLKNNDISFYFENLDYLKTKENYDKLKYPISTIRNSFDKIDGDFIVNIKKVYPNKLIYTFKGKAIINDGLTRDDDDLKAIIDCTEHTIQEITFDKKGFIPLLIDTKQNGCKVEGLALAPFITEHSLSYWHSLKDMGSVLSVKTYVTLENIDVIKKMQFIYLRAKE